MKDLDRDQLVQAFRLSDYVSENYTVTGRNTLKLCCPFHDDRNPSLTININSQRFKCHSSSCGVHGTIIDWLILEQGISVAEAFKYIRNELGVENKGSSYRADVVKNPFDLSKYAEPPITPPALHKIWLNNLLTSHEGLSYLERRGFNRDDIIRFGFGFNRKHQRIVIPTWRYHPYETLDSYQGRAIDKNATVQHWQGPRRQTLPTGLNSLMTDQYDIVFVFLGGIDCYSAQKHGIPAISLGGTEYYKTFKPWWNLVKHKKAVIVADRGEEEAGKEIAQWWRNKFHTNTFQYKWPKRLPNGYDFNDFAVSADNPAEFVAIVFRWYVKLQSTGKIRNPAIGESLTEIRKVLNV